MEPEEAVVGRMEVKKEEETTNVGKANAGTGSIKKEDTNVGKAKVGSAAILFDKPLFHVLTLILQLKLDGQHSYIRKYLRLRKCEYIGKIWKTISLAIILQSKIPILGKYSNFQIEIEYYSLNWSNL